MSRGKAAPVVQLVVCGACERNRFQVPALVELRPGRCICTFCIRTAVETLVKHYGGHDALMAHGDADLAPVPA